jgi:hypothetical protein
MLEFFLRGTQSRRERAYLAGAVTTVIAYILALLFFSVNDVPMDKVFLAKRDAVRIAFATAHPLPLNQKVAASNHGHAPSGMALLEGWSGVEPWGVWSQSKTTKLCLIVPAGTMAPLQLDLWALIVLDQQGTQNIQAYANGQIIGSWTLRTRQTVLTMNLPKSASGTYLLVLDIKHPEHARGSMDPRTLGIGLLALEIQPQPQPK